MRTVGLYAFLQIHFRAKWNGNCDNGEPDRKEMKHVMQARIICVLYGDFPEFVIIRVSRKTDYNTNPDTFGEQRFGPSPMQGLSRGHLG